MIIHALLTILSLPALCQETGVVGLASCEQLAPRELRLTVSLRNYGETFDRDLSAFIHFDRGETSERLYTQAPPGLRPIVAPTQSSAWTPDEIVTLTFGPVTIPTSTRRTVYVKLGLYDPGGGVGRFALVGADRTDRVLLGAIDCSEDACRWLSRPPTPTQDHAEQIGVRPRGLVRSMPDPPAVRFGEEDLDLWTVEPISGGTADLARTREDLCWSESSLEVTYTGEGLGSGFVLRPPQPLPVADEADVARIWIMGRSQVWVPRRPAEEAILSHWVEVRDSGGETRHLRNHHNMGYPYWYVARSRIPADWPRPLVCTGIGFSGCTNPQPRTFLLDALVFAKERLAETLATDVRFDDLPFPTDPDGLLPDAPPDAFENHIKREGEAWVLSFEGETDRLEYSYTPLTGSLADIRATWRRGDVSETMTLAGEGGVVVEIAGRKVAPTDRTVTRELVDMSDADNAITARWRVSEGGESVEYTLRLSIKARSLLVEMDSDGRSVAGVDAGSFVGPPGSDFVSVPYWTYGLWDYGRDGGVVMTENVFASGYPDWYRSRASHLVFGSGFSHEPEALAGGSLTYAPGVEYIAPPDGQRSPLRERYVFTVSPNVTEVLPNIPHPPTTGRDRLATMCHSTGGSAERMEEQFERWERMASYGVTDVYIRHFDGMWADGAQGPQDWTLTNDSAPIAGNVAVKAYLAKLQELGFCPVLYTNYTDLQPVSPEFDWDNVMWLESGDISDACWPGSYPIKPIRAVELEAKYAPRIAERFGTTGSFCDVHTAVSPWWKVDFDPRLPGAGEFGTTYRCYAKLLLNERDTYGAVYSEGSMQWLYAGLASGSDGELDAPAPHLEPFLVDFDLRKIHPLEMGAGMSWIHRYVKSPDEADALGGWEAAQDRFTAATLAYGHQGTFTALSFRGYSTDIKTYHMLRPLQELYAMRQAEEILYHDPETDEMLDASAALHSGAYRESQVYTRYETGLRVWVNGSLGEQWAIDLNGEAYELPPSGFLASGPSGLLVFSALLDGARVDSATWGDVAFADARGKLQPIGPLKTDGAALLKKASDKRWTLWPLGNMTALTVSVPADAVTVQAFDEDGAPLELPETTVFDTRVLLPTDLGAFRYELTIP